jgi:hypothetical protein
MYKQNTISSGNKTQTPVKSDPNADKNQTKPKRQQKSNPNAYETKRKS